MGAKKGKGKGGKKGKGKTGCGSGDAQFLLFKDVYAKVKLAIDMAKPEENAAGTSFRVCMDCATLNSLLGSVGLAWSQNCKKKKGKGKKGKGGKGKGGKKGGK